MGGPVKLCLQLCLVLVIIVAWNNRDRAYRWTIDSTPPTELIFVTATERDASQLDRALAQFPVDTRDDLGSTALCFAAHAGHTNAIERLLAAGADINIATPSGWTPIMFAINGRHPKTVQLLLDRGADPTCRTPTGVSVYDFAEIFDTPECAAVLPPNPATLSADEAFEPH